MNWRGCILRLAMLAACALGLPGAAARAELAGLELILLPEDESLRETLEEALLPIDFASETPFEAERLAEAAGRRIVEKLNAEGYFAASVAMDDIAPPPARSVLRVKAGKPFRYGAIRIELKGEAEPALAARVSPGTALRSGMRVLPRDVAAEEARIEAELKLAGYAFAKVLERDALGDEAAGTIDLTLRFETGAPIRLGAVMFPGDLAQKPERLQAFVPFDADVAYSPERLNELNERLMESGLFSFASARIDPEGEVQADGTHLHRVIVTARERARDTVSAGASYASSEGIGVTGEWKRRNLTGRSDTLEAMLVVASEQRTLNIAWTYPNAYRHGRTLILSGAGGRDETDAFDRDFLTLDGAIEIRRGKRDRLRFAASLEASRESGVDASSLVSERDLQIASASVNVARDETDRLLDPREGWRAEARIEPGAVIGDASAGYVHGWAQLSVYHPAPVSDNVILAARIRAGSTFGASAVDLPVSRKFFAGGGGSVRGFPYQSIGPQDDQGRPVGGRSKLEVSAEARWQSGGRWGAAAFVDAGTVSTRDVPDFSGIRTGMGFGVFYQTPAGPLRADIAWPAGAADRGNGVQVYITLGQAF